MRLAFALLMLACAGCSTTEVSVQGLRFPVPAGAGALALTVEDARPPDTERTHLGVRRITMGIPRAVCVAEGEALSAALRESLSASLTRAGFSIVPEGTSLTVRVRRLEADGYFGELTLEFDLELTLGEAKPVRRSGKRVGHYSGADGYVVALSEALTAVLADLFAAKPLHGAGAPPPDCLGCKKPLEPGWVACPHCGRTR